MQDTNNKGGGPKTDAGKAVSRLNAVSHGLLSKQALLEGEDAKTLQSLTDSLYEEFNPAGELESFLVDRMAAEMWRMRRAIAAERNLFISAKDKANTLMFPEDLHGSKEAKKAAADIASLIDPNNDRIMRYANGIERSFFRALHELQRLQMSRNGGLVMPPVIVDVNTDRSLED